MDELHQLSPIVQVIIAVSSSYLLLARFRYQKNIQGITKQFLSSYNKSLAKNEFHFITYLSLDPRKSRALPSHAGIEHLWFKTFFGKVYQYIYKRDVDNKICLFIIIFWTILLLDISIMQSLGHKALFLLYWLQYLANYFNIDASNYKYILIISMLLSLFFPAIFVFCGRSMVSSIRSYSKYLAMYHETARDLDSDAADVEIPDFD
ncbi:MAG: hypothetical protein OFPII_32420 [Osedax symbiont Rs1]|nr:MAG: hypothetical protein OFPII_32420 [Osedax symbiont Rs1]